MQNLPFPSFLSVWAEQSWQSCLGCELAEQTTVLRTTRKFQIIRGPSSELLCQDFVGKIAERLEELLNPCNVNALCRGDHTVCSVQFEDCTALQ